MAEVGNFLQIKPVLKMHAGSPTIERVRTSKRAMVRLLSLVSDLVPLERVALVHTHAPEKAEALRQRVAHILPSNQIPSVDITPVIGANIGPGAVGFACVSAQSS
jgi:fatty acid-binding protein DegV